MNIQAINASPTLGRRQVPRANNVSFGNNINGAAKTAAKSKGAALKNGLSNAAGFVKNIVKNIPDAVKKLGGKIKEGAAFAGSKVLDGFKTVIGATQKGYTKASGKIADFVNNHKGAKGVKIAAMALTSVVAGAFALKELYDIITKSNSRD